MTRRERDDPDGPEIVIDEETSEPNDPDGLMNDQEMPTADGEVVRGGAEAVEE